MALGGRVATDRPRRRAIAFVLGAAVLLHWVFDLIVHTPDLPLLGDGSTKAGFGLWNDAPVREC